MGAAGAALVAAWVCCGRRRRRSTPNPVIAKLARGETVFGLINQGDPSLANARRSRAPRWTSSTPTWSTARSTSSG